MTVTYTHKVANARLGGFSSLLVRWRGSVYKLFYKEFLIYITLYCLLSLVYRFALFGDQKKYFEKLCLQFQNYTDLVPISFVLGFYVTIVVGRWWSQLENLPFPDRLMMIIGSNVHGTDDRGRLLRRTLLRYLNLSQVLTYRLVSTAVYKRFPSIEHVVKAGLMTENEYQQYESVKSVNLKYWVPLMWFSNLVSKIRQEGRIYDDMIAKHLMEELNVFRGFCGWLINYDWISVPLVYTQVVTVAVYMFFMSTLLSRQYLDISEGYKGHEVDLFVPIFTIGQFFFYMGWLKVAEQLINPFGEDDDDFEVNWCIDRNHEVTMIVADQMYAKHPKLEKDKFWNVANPDIPYTEASANHKVEPYMGSTFDMRVDKDDMQIVHSYNSNTRMAPLNEISTDVTNKPPNFHDKVNEAGSFMASSGFLAPFRHNTRKHFKSDKIGLLSNNNDEEDSDDSNDESSPSSVGLAPTPSRRMFRKTLLGVGFYEQLRDPHDSNPDDPNDDIITSDESGDDTNDDADVEADDGDSDVTETEGGTNKTLTSAKDEKAKSKLKKSNENILEERNALQRTRKSPKKRSNESVPKLVIDRVESKNMYPGITPQIDSDDEERRNAEERVYLSTRKRRSKGTLPPRKRRFYKSGGNQLILRHQQRLRRDSFVLPSPDTGSMFSETDVGSGNNFSPFGSSQSFGTSIPSPKQLRFAFRLNARHLYGDTTSMTSSMPSPSGNEGEGTDNPGTPLSPLIAYEPNKSGVWGPGVSPHDVTMPFTENLRKRLQVVPSASPSVTSRGPFDPANAPSSNNQNLLMIADEVPLKSAPKVVQKGNHLSVQTKAELNATKLQTTTFNAFPSLGKRRKTDDKVTFVDDNNNQQVGFATAETKRGSGTGLWNAFKWWNAKRKQKKQPSVNFRTVSSESDVMKFYDDPMKVADMMSVELKEDWGLEMRADGTKLEDKPLMKVTRTVSRSEEGRSGVPDDADSGMMGTGEITWESECGLGAKSPKQTVSNRPKTLKVQSVLDKETNKLEDNKDSNSLIRVESNENDSSEQPKTIEAVLSDASSSLGSRENDHSEEDEVPHDVLETIHTDQYKDDLPPPLPKTIAEISAEEERGYKSSSDEGYESSNIPPRVIMQSPTLRHKISVFRLQSIPEKVSDDESRDEAKIVEGHSDVPDLKGQENLLFESDEICDEPKTEESATTPPSVKHDT